MDMDNVQMQLIMTADQYMVVMSHNKRLDVIKHFSVCHQFVTFVR